jgi:16S rRNA (cytidine1402-2'-O)-methyltransferase
MDAVKKSGVLFVVATPIGNLADITYRAVETLREVDMIAVEDSRHSGALLRHYQIAKPLLALHEHNEDKQSERLVANMLAGGSVALISDAGTPLVSDPGYRLVRHACEAGIRVLPLPGPCAAIAALSVAGLPCDRFVFEGFLSPKSAARKARLKELMDEQRTVLFYEAPHRILKLIDAMISVFGENRRVVVGREMTKIFETFYRGSLLAIKQELMRNDNQQKGEFVVLLQGAEPVKETDGQAILVLDLLLKELPLSRAVALAAKITGLRKKDLYSLGLSLERAFTAVCN